MDSKYFKTVPKEIFLHNRYGSTQMHSFHCGFPIQEKSVLFFIFHLRTRAQYLNISKYRRSPGRNFVVLS